MSDAKNVTFSLRVMINKEKTKVLFAEADSDFADVLFSFLTLPLGKIMRVLEKHYGENAIVIGSLSTLYNSISNLDSVFFGTEHGKLKLLNPESPYQNPCYTRATSLSKLKISLNGDQPTYCQLEKFNDGVFTRNTVSFIICDDLRVVPNVKGSVIQTLGNLGIAITDVEGAETRDVTLGFNEVVNLLKGFLISRNPLTDLILGKRQMNSATVKSDLNLLHKIEKEADSNSNKSILKAMVQKSTNKLLLAQAEDDFIDFLFSILTIPLGRVGWLLGSNTCHQNIDNLYKSVVDNVEHLIQATKDWLIKPGLIERTWTTPNKFPLSKECLRPTNFVENLVKGPRMFMVTDDLTVTPLGLSSTLSALSQMKISLSDVEELELHVGLEEALSILKASLTSTTALTDALINPIQKKQPKLDRYR